MVESNEDFQDELEQRVLYDTYVAEFHYLKFDCYVSRWYEYEFQRQARSIYRDYLIDLHNLKIHQRKRRNPF